MIVYSMILRTLYSARVIEENFSAIDALFSVTLMAQ